MTTPKPYRTGWLVSALTHSIVASTAAVLFASVEPPVRPESFQMLITVPAPAAEPLADPPPTMKSVSPAPPISTPAHHGEREVSLQSPVQRQVVAERQVVSRQLMEVNAVPMPETVASEASVVAHAVTEQVMARTQPVQTSDSVEAHTAVPTTPPVSMETLAPPSPTSDSRPVTTKTVSQYSPSSSLAEEQPIETWPAHAAALPQPAMRPSIVQREVHADYGWLSAALRARIEELKRYPSFAKSRRWEGTVVIEADINDAGDIVRLQVAETSGYAVLDEEAMAVVRKSSPVPLRYPLGQPYITIRVPIAYKLHA